MKSLFEKLNRLDDSLVESKRVVKKKKLTESLQKKQLKENYQISSETWNNIKNYADLETTTGRDFAYDGPYADEVDFLYGAAIDQYNEAEGTDVEYEASIQNGRGASELFDDQGGHAYRDFETECDELLDFAREATCLEDFMSSLVSYIYSFAEDLEYDEDDYDDDIDEMLTESTEQYELSTLVKDSINHLVNGLGKDPMADDFGDDVCADLENNYDIYVPENPVKYADWCDAVMSEVSRQLNNKEEQLTEDHKEYEVYMDSGISDEDEFFTDIRNAKRFAKDLVKRYGKLDNNAPAIIKRSNGDPLPDNWPVLYTVKYDSENDSFKLFNRYGVEEQLIEKFENVTTLEYQYITDDDDVYLKKGMTQEEIDTAFDTGNFPDKMWLNSEADITEEGGWYQVSWGGWDDYYEEPSIEDCKKRVEEYYDFGFRWID